MPSPLEPLANPPSLLGYHRQLAPSAGVKVSPLCLGGMSLGTRWADFVGECDEKASFEILDYFYSQGGNFIDTASNYQAGDSERIIGKWMKERRLRDEIVLATKYCAPWRYDEGRNIVQSNFGGMNAKALKHSLEDSLEKLQTSFIDVLYVHHWDHAAGIPEVMQALNDMVARGKVLYLGISNTPAWIVAKANEYAKTHQLRQFVIYQGLWNAAKRDFERDIIPLARMDGMALAPWGVLGQGTFKTKAQREATNGKMRQAMIASAADQEMVIEKLEKIAERESVSMQAIALAYVFHKSPYVFPIVGSTKIEQIKGNIEALGIRLSREDLDEVDMATGKPFDLGWPNNVFTLPSKRDVSGSVMAKDLFANTLHWNGDEVPFAQPIQHGQH